MSEIREIVKKWRIDFDLPVRDKLTIPSVQEVKQAISLIAEELQELYQAVHQNNIVEIIDALGDLKWVTENLYLQFGVSEEKLTDIVKCVNVSNSSKMCNNLKEAEETQEEYRKLGINTYQIQVENKIKICRTSDGKVLKNKYWSLPDFTPVLKGTEVQILQKLDNFTEGRTYRIQKTSPVGLDLINDNDRLETVSTGNYQLV